MESKTESSFLMCRLLPLLSTINIPLVDFVYILKAFYHLPLRLVLFTPTIINNSEYTQAGLEYTLN